MLALLGTLLLSLSYDYPRACNVDYRRYPYELFETAEVYLAGPPEERFKLDNAADVRHLVDFLKVISPFDQAGIDDNSLILGFIRFQPGGSRLVITETSISDFGCVKKLSDEQQQEFMSILRRNAKQAAE